MSGVLVLVCGCVVRALVSVCVCVWWVVCCVGVGLWVHHPVALVRACRVQLPIGSGGVALRYQRSSRMGVRGSEDLTNDELFAFAPAAHDAASLIQRLFRRLKRKKWR